MSVTEQQEESIFQKEEIHEMFNTSFLPKLQEIARRAKEKNLPEKEVEFFNVQLVLQFSELNEPLTYESIENKVQMQLQPVTKDDLEKGENDGSDLGDE